MAQEIENIALAAQEDNGESIGIKDIWQLSLAKWQWFIYSLIICLGLATAYVLCKAPSYTRSASLLIKEDAQGGASSFGDQLSAFSDMGMFKSSSSVDNELIAFQSPALMLEVVKRLELDVNYATDGVFHKEHLYGRTLPVKLKYKNIADRSSFSFKMQLEANGNFTLTKVKYSTPDGMVDADDITGKLGKAIRTPMGELVFERTPYYISEEMTLYVRRSSIYNTLEACQNKLTVELADKNASVINLTYQDLIIQRAEEVLNTIIQVYNENWVKDKNQIAISTSEFISERLRVIERELGTVDSDISSYKSSNLIPDIQQASKMYMEQANEANNQVMLLNNSLYMAKYVKQFVQNETNKHQLLPANSGIGSKAIEEQIATYNEKQLERNSMASNSSETNPYVVDLDEQLKQMRNAIVMSINNEINSLNTQISTMRANENMSTSKIASNPNQAKYLLSVERQQKVKEALYLFLLQKREENELSQAFTAYNTRIITPPMGDIKPTAPVKKKILLIAFALGMIIPLAIIYTRESLNTKVRGKKDLDQLTTPFIGEIPDCSPRKNFIRKLFERKSKKKDNEKHRETIIKEGSRDIVNEAFRVVRTNIDFIAKDKNKNVILITSFNPGSGKSFISANLGMSFAIKGKKILVIDGDLRHGSASAYVNSPDHGLCDYLSGNTTDWKRYIVKDATHPNFQVLPIGKIPPNPTELIEEGKFERIIEEARSEYDYIFVDCPPVDMLADTQIIEKWTDRTVFVIRAGLMERYMLPEIDNIYTTKKYKNMSIILNGTLGGGKYGYKYGYNYGYSYGNNYYGSGK